MKPGFIKMTSDVDKEKDNDKDHLQRPIRTRS